MSDKQDEKAVQLSMMKGDDSVLVAEAQNGVSGGVGQKKKLLE